MRLVSRRKAGSFTFAHQTLIEVTHLEVSSARETSLYLAEHQFGLALRCGLTGREAPTGRRHLTMDALAKSKDLESTDPTLQLAQHAARVAQ